MNFLRWSTHFTKHSRNACRKTNFVEATVRKYYAKKKTVITKLPKF